MRRRLFALLIVATVSGVLAGTVAGAKDRGRTRAARIPALPRSAELSSRCPLPAGLRPAFVAASRDADLPLALLVAVGEVESNLVSSARSAADARGVLQVLPSTGAALELDVDRTATNVLAGARYLRQLFDRLDSADLALAAYNAGPTAVTEAGGAPTAATASYVADVTARWRTLRGCR